MSAHEILPQGSAPGDLPTARVAPVTADNIAHRAADWGSYMNASDPGACMYGFSFDGPYKGAVAHEAHRAACLAYIDAIKPATPGYAADLAAIRAYIEAAPVREG